MGGEGEFTLLLRDAAAGSEAAFDQAVALVYADLEGLARGQLRRRFGRDADALTLDPGSLVHETYLRLLRQRNAFENRAQFFAIATRVMLRVLSNYHRERATAKRGGGTVRVTLTGVELPGGDAAPEIPVALQALSTLADDRPRVARVVHLRVLWGLEMGEIAEVLEVSLATVERDWRFGRAWLRAELERADA